MAANIFIKGNYFVVLDSTNNNQIIRVSTSDLNYIRDGADNFAFQNRVPTVNNYGAQDLNRLGRTSSLDPLNNPEPNIGYIFPYTEIQDEGGNPIGGFDSMWATVDDFDQWLADNTGQSQLNITVDCSGGGAEWTAPRLALGAFEPGGVSVASFVAAAGFGFSFLANQDNDIAYNCELGDGPLEYPGSGLVVHLHWQIFAAPDPGENVKWELRYAFLDDGGNNLTQQDGIRLMDIDVSARTPQQQYTDSFDPIAGPAGATHLQMTITRNGQGPLSDTYDNDADVYSVGILKL